MEDKEQKAKYTESLRESLEASANRTETLMKTIEGKKLQLTDIHEKEKKEMSSRYRKELVRMAIHYEANELINSIDEDPIELQIKGGKLQIKRRHEIEILEMRSRHATDMGNLESFYGLQKQEAINNWKECTNRLNEQITNEQITM